MLPPIQFHIIAEMQEKITWYMDSPNAGDPKCLCSFCKHKITAGELPIRFYRRISGVYAEARLHVACAKSVIQELATKP